MASPSDKTHASWKNLVAGTLGGSAGTILLYPLDLVKVRLQVNEDSAKQKSSAHRRTIWKTMTGVVRHEGVPGLYQGLTPALLGSAVSWGGFFFLYEGIKSQMIKNQTDKEEMLGSGENFAASCLSGAALVILTNPIWLIKTRMQLQLKRVQQEKLCVSEKGSKEAVKAPYKHIFDAVRTIVREEGPMALYKGAVPAMMLVSNGGVQMVTYEFLKTRFGEYKKVSRSREYSNSTHGRLQDSIGYLAMGASSKMIATTVTYPIQLVKSRLQQRSHVVELTISGEVEVVKRKYHGVLDCTSKILTREGVSGFFKGCIPNAIRVAPNAAITFMVYETVNECLS